jgi:Uma2 family endonuclease
MSSSAANVRHKLSVSDYYRMGDAGILHEDSRVELIEGELIDMSPIGSHHAGIVTLISHLLNKKISDQAIVSVQNPVRLSDWSEPQPDIMLLKPRSDYYYDSHPKPSDVLVLIEVADSSIDYDRKTKLPLYARSGIQEFWIIDMNTQRLERYTQPNETGYGYCETLDKTGKISPTALPDVVIDLSRILV